MAEITLDRYQGGEYGVYDAQDDHIIGNSETAFTLNQLEAELAASKAQSAQLAAALEELVNIVDGVIESGTTVNLDSFTLQPATITLAAWQQANK
jgi:hypothetical protein